ncbi:MAG: helix-turn-helix transcriptional regulator [Betaproteobacteria bacterium]|nr:helix-turn-helix transcriptional regulator [Betaproteobacteria bacterium]
MTTSKQIVIKHLQAKIDEGYTQKEIAKHLGYPNPNFVSMLMNENYPKTIISMNRLKALATFCNLTPTDILHLALTRLTDAGGAPVEFSKGTMLWLLRIFGQALKARTLARGVGV